MLAPQYASKWHNTTYRNHHLLGNMMPRATLYSLIKRPCVVVEISATWSLSTIWGPNKNWVVSNSSSNHFVSVIDGLFSLPQCLTFRSFFLLSSSSNVTDDNAVVSLTCVAT